MLVLTRRKGQTICCGVLEVVVLRITPGQVKLGIVAPAETRIRRGELKPLEDSEYDQTLFTGRTP